MSILFARHILVAAVCSFFVILPARAITLIDVAYELFGNVDGDAAAAASFYYNGVPLPGMNGKFTFDPASGGNLFRAEFSANGTSGEQPGVANGSLGIQAALPAASGEEYFFRGILQGRVNSNGIDAFSSAGAAYDCFFVQGCWELNVGLNEEVFEVVTQTDTLFGNFVLINGARTDAGRTGGPETFSLEFLFRLADPVTTPVPANWMLDFRVNHNLAAVESTASISYVLEFELLPIPLPAAAWLFGSSLLLLPGLRWLRSILTGQDAQRRSSDRSTARNASP